MSAKRIVPSVLAVALCGGVVAFILAGNAPRRPLTGPAAHPWASWPVGTWAEMSVVVAGRSWTERWEVVAVDEAGVRLRVTEAGRKPDEQVIATAPEAYVDEGVEALTLAGRTFTCRRQSLGGSRRWLCGELPAWPVREENEEGKTELVRIGEAAGGRSCMVFETRFADGGRATRWKSLEVPGQVVREVRTADIGEARVEVAAYGRP